MALFWKSSINLTVIGSCKYYIDAIVDKGTENEWQLTGFYDEPETARRVEAWEKLRSIPYLIFHGYVLGILMR